MNYLDNLKVGDTLTFDITKKHPIFEKMSTTWRKCRDAYEGEEAIKAGGTRYLYALDGQSPDDYNKYKGRAQFYQATTRTVQAYLGMLFRKDPIMNYIDKDGKPIEDDATLKSGEKFFSKVTWDGKSIEDFLRSVVEDVVTVNKLGILLDFPSVTNPNGEVTPMSRAEYERLGLKPLLSMYKAESIINWYWEVRDNNLVPRLFVLQEEGMEFVDENSIVPEEVVNYRILYLQETSQGMQYKQFLIKPQKSDSNAKELDFVVNSIITPLNNGRPLDFIPFYIMTDKGLDYRDNSASMINGLVNTNIAHYRNSADYENELHWVGIKTLYLAGWDEEKEVVLGKALTGPEGSMPHMIEPKSDSGLKDEMKSKEERMAVLGAERIAQKGRYIPSAETARINSESENATLINMSKSLSVSISKVLTYQMQWAGEFEEDKKIDMELNTDFFDENLTGQEALQWIQAVQQGGVSFDTYYYNMDKKEAFPAGWTKEQEAEKLQEGFPGGVPGNLDDDFDTFEENDESGNQDDGIIDE